MAHMFAPLTTSFLGFDSFFNDIERMLGMASNQTLQGGYPPLNLYQEADGGYTIEAAVAGFKKEHIRIEHNPKTGVLSIYGDTGQRSSLSDPVPAGVASTALTNLETRSTAVTEAAPSRVALKTGIATRQFARHFTIADTLEVKGAKMEDGMLTITVGPIPAAEVKPLQIAIS